jgi:beta-glucanase (GH16 family)
MRLAPPQAAHHGTTPDQLSGALSVTPARLSDSFTRHRAFGYLARLAAALLLSAGIAYPLHAQNWTLVWNDEFNSAAGTYPDASKWTYDLGNNNGWGNGELENYCKPGSNTAPCVASQPNAYQDGNGNLVIQARRDSSGNWTSARLKTQGIYQFQYGRVEARMKLEVGDGLWPAFWMLGANINQVGWPQTGEDDIMEWVQSYGPNTTSSTTHGPGYSGGNGIGARYTFPNGGRVDDASYHIYGLLWSPNLLQYYRDSPSNIFLTITPSTIPSGTQWVYNNPFFILLNFAIGSGGFPGGTDSSTPSVATTLIDYVRVYQQSGTTTPPSSLNGTHTLTPGNATSLRLDDVAANTAAGNPVDIYTANGTGAQNWAFSSSGVVPSGNYNIAVLGPNCLSASGTASGAAVNIEPCNGSSAQSWNAVAAGSVYALHPASNPNLCLDVRGAGTSNGTVVQSWTCNGTGAQQWAIQ